ncbi:hypothetical protein QQX98_012495 [Neonectria punicea]|uniref:Methyltransferase n=1 Tax=Neonectria punicea TaxID=979145 RepID=A0ABR1GJ13_9HYPO
MCHIELDPRLSSRKREDLSSIQRREPEYSLPSDAQENERLDLQHHLFLLTFDDKLGLAPPNSPEWKAKRVLDVGTGTGIWVMDYGDEHPEAKVIGVDLSPIQPVFVPPNVEFNIDDIDEQWTYSQPFDYIHSRMMNFSIQNWPEYLRKIYSNLTPGGYVELQEVGVFAMSDDETLRDEHELAKCFKLLDEASIKHGRAYQAIDGFKGIVAEAGFVDVVESRFKWPTNAWPKDKKHKEIGLWNNENMSIALESLTMAAFTRAHGWSREEVTLFLAGVRKDMNNPKIHAYWSM